jgi:competence ComEA-like helix-hairpin-helix protein
MAKIALRAYHHEVEGLIESNQSEEALAHCRYILQSFPKYLETYRLMGKFYLESQRYGEASDVFQRVLSSMPDDFVAHVGMSMIRQDEGNLDAAIWHMERAFESQPYNSAIQGELKRLYGRRDGLEPSKIRLTRGALARMYIKGGLHQQAIAELRAALAEDNKRPDLQVLLANAYFQADQRVEAVEASSSLIKKLPYCFEANRILACILPNTDRSKDAEIYRQRVVALDPYFVNLKLATPTSESVPDQAIVMDRLTWQTGDKAKAIDSSQPTWARDIGVSFKNEESLPDWLTEGGESEQSTSPFESEPSAPFSWDETPEETEAATPTKEEDIPDWMRQAGWGQSTGDFQEGPVDFDTPLADETPSADGLAPADMPDWLRGMAPADALAQGDDLPPREETMSWLEEPTSSPESPASDWLENLGNPPATPSGASASSTDMPDWLQGLAPEQPASTNASQPTIDAGDLDWLNGLDDSTPAASEPAAAADLPDWMQSLEPAQPSATSESAADNLDWLQGIEASTPAASEPAVAADLPDWMQSLEPAQPAATSEPAADNMDWLQGIEASTPAVNEEGNETAAADIPDWMQNLDTSEQSTPAADQPSAAPGITGMTDWLQSLEHEEAAPAQASNDIPDWLSEIQTSEEATPPEAPGLADTTPPAFTQPALTDEKPEMDWLQSLTADETTTSDEAPTDGMPDWLTALEPETPASTSPTESAQETGIPEWLLESEATALAPDTADSPETSETPDWLATGEESSGVTGFLTSLNVPSKEPQGMEQPASPNEADALVWLDGLMGEGGISEDSLFSGETTPAAGPAAPAATPSEEAIPDWLQATADEEPPAHEVAPAAAEAAPGELPAWLTEAAIEPVVEAEPVEAEPAQVPDWLSAIEAEADQFEAQQAAPSGSIPEAAVEPEPELPQVEIPEVPSTTPELSAEANAMAWLDGLMGEGGISEDALFSGTTEEKAAEVAPATSPAEEAIASTPSEPIAATEPVESLTDEWLSTVEAEADQFDTQQAAAPAVEAVPTPPSPEATASIPDLSDEAAAMAWLEGLAAKQGVSEEELFTPVEKRTETPPAWVEADAEVALINNEPAIGEEPIQPAEMAEDEAAPVTASVAPFAEEPVIEEQPAETNIPAWLSAIEADADEFEMQTAALVEPEPPAIEVPDEPTEVYQEPIIQHASPDWLLSIQEESDEGEIAAEMVTQPEPAATPDWLNTVVEEPEELAPPAPTEPTPATVEEIPAWQQPTKTISRSGLAAAMARIEAAPEPPAPEEPETGLDVNTASLVQLEALPGIGFILAQNIINYRETYGAFTSLDDLQKVSGVGPTTINELRQWLRVVAPRTAERFANRATPLGGALEEARVHLAQNDPGKAAQIYGQLLRSGHSVSEIVGDLQNALYRYPVDIGLWQVLGEAYLLNDQLQEALEAYSKAEELLR